MTNRQISVDVLKIVMAVFVVGIHANPLAGLGDVAVTLSGEGLFRVAVPVFFVLNGYFFEAVSQRGDAPRYIGRLLLLYLLWTLLYLPGWSATLGLPQPWPPLLRVLVMGYWQLWYLPALALAVALAAGLRGFPLPAILWLMAASFVGGVAIVYAIAFDLLHPSPLYFGDMTVLHRNGLLLGFPFVMGGLLIRRYRLDERISMTALGATLVTGLALLTLESTVLSLTAPQRVNHDNLLSLAIACPALVLLALKFPRRAAGRLGTYANGLFFLHAAVCIAAYRHTDLSRVWIFSLALVGSLIGTWALIRTGLAKRLL